MTRHVAFLRGLNVGGHRVKMDRLRSLFADLGFENVATFIASGNVIFDTAETDRAVVEGRISAGLRAALGYDVAAFVRSIDEVAEVAAADPFAAGTDLANRHVTFLHEPLGADAAAAWKALATPTDAFAVRGTEAYWATAGKMTESPVEAKDLARAIGRAPNTMRNQRTVRRLVDKFAP